MSVDAKHFFGGDWFATRKLSDDVIAFREDRSPQDVLCYLVLGKSRNALIDTGIGLANIRNLIPLDKPTIVLLTHTHWDHMGCAAEFEQVGTFDNKYEIERLRKGWSIEELSSFNANTLPFLGIEPTLIHPHQIRGVENVNQLRDSQEIDLGNKSLKVIHTPGHTPGSTCYFLENEGFLFSGDTICPGSEFLHMPESNPIAYAISLAKLHSATRESLVGIFPGHNTFSTSPDLLDRHLSAMNGLLTPESVTNGQDSISRFVEKKWSDFSFRLPLH